MLIYISPNKIRTLFAIFLMIVLCILSILNFEHVVALKSTLPFRSLALIADDAVLKGAKHSSTYSKIYAGICGFILLIFLISIKRTHALFSTTLKQNLVGLCLLIALAAYLNFWPIKFSESHWHQSNPIAENIAQEWSKLKYKGRDVPVSDEAKAIYSELLKSDLSGELRYRGDKKNVLLILIEGVSGHHIYQANNQEIWLDDVSMPQLAKASKNSINYTHFIAPQVQTNRGEYAFLCGDLPNLSAEVAKMTVAEGILESTKRKCLPKILNEAGYSTSYLQAAGMQFMSKNSFMPLAGFENSNGLKWFKKPYFKHTWGIGDEDFFKQSIKEVERLENLGKPWFLTLLTVGTHHNYTVPEKYTIENKTPYGNAVAHADAQVMVLLDRLSELGIPEDTLIIISADESQGSSKDKTHLSKNWIPFIVFDKGIAPQEIQESFNQSDFSLSIIDYLNLTNSLEILPAGRSIFRKYESQRHQFFARHLDHATYWFSKGNVLLKCDRSHTTCKDYHYKDASFLWTPHQFSEGIASNEKINIAKYVSQENDWDFERFFDDSSVRASDKEPWLGQYFMSSKLKGKSLVRAHKNINFKWKKGAPYPGFPLYSFGAIWQTCIHVEQSSQLIVNMSADEGANLYIDGELIIDGWKKQSRVRHTDLHAIDAGMHHIRMEYRAFYWGSFAKLNLDIRRSKEAPKGSKNAQKLRFFPPRESDPSQCDANAITLDTPDS